VKKLKQTMVLFLILATVGVFNQKSLEAVTYVTDSGGYAYDESRAAPNLAPAIALSTVAIVAIIALAVQNSHNGSSCSSSSCSSSSFCHCDCR
jgi:ABC-type uncharacterized transport system YnjBCD permease subunit